MFAAISARHLAMALLSGLGASQDNRFNFMMFFYKGKKLNFLDKEESINSSSKHVSDKVRTCI